MKEWRTVVCWWWWSIGGKLHGAGRSPFAGGGQSVLKIFLQRSSVASSDVLLQRLPPTDLCFNLGDSASPARSKSLVWIPLQ